VDLMDRSDIYEPSDQLVCGYLMEPQPQYFTNGSLIGVIDKKTDAKWKVRLERARAVREQEKANDPVSGCLLCGNVTL
jgi:hypothetical protein